MVLPDPVLYLGYCHPGEVKALWMESVINLLGRFPVIIQGCGSGPLISRSRNIVAERFMTHPEATHLLMTDVDVVFTPEDVQKLLDLDKPIVGGLYFGYTENPNAKVPIALGEDANAIKKIPKGPAPVTAIGMGLTLIKREVFEAMPPDYRKDYPFSSGYWEDISHYAGEDFIFCARAKELGFETWLHPGARLGHIKSVVL